MVKQFCFRWDIDHLKCLDNGVPNILSVCKKHNIKCSFFVNMGKAVDLKLWLSDLSTSINKLTETNSVNLIKKIGYLELVKILLINPNIGCSRINVLKQIISEGHDLGLHGGMNHVIWSRKLENFSFETLDAELYKTISVYNEKVASKLEGFVSPGFKCNKNVLNLLDKYKIKYSGDLFYDEPFYPKIDGKKLSCLQIPVNIIGPNTIPIIEYLYSKKYKEKEIIKIVESKIKEKELAVIYGHPLFEGLMTNILEQLFEFVKEKGYEVVTMKDIYFEYKDTARSIDVAI